MSLVSGNQTTPFSSAIGNYCYYSAGGVIHPVPQEEAVWFLRLYRIMAPVAP